MSSGDSRQARSNKLLCVGHLRHDLVHLHRVAERATVEAGFSPCFLITAPAGLIAEPRQYLSSHGLPEVRLATVDYAPLEIRNPFTRYRALRQANLTLAREILDSVQPTAVLATVDACHDLLLSEATARGIPTIYMQVAFWGDWTFYRNLWADDQQAAEHRATLRQTVTAPLKKIIQRGYGLHNRPAWWRKASRIAVMGKYWEEILAHGGIPRRRIAVTGNPHCDDIFNIRAGRGGQWADLYERLRLPHGTRYMLHCREHHARLKALSADASEDGQREILGALKGVCPGMPIVVKMHPRDTPEDYDLVRSLHPAVIVAGDVPMVELLAQSLVMVTTISTTQLWSAALDRPTISAFFWKGLAYWEKATAFSGVERVFTPEQLRRSVARHLTDSAYQRLWQEKRKRFIDEMLVVDGYSIDRIVHLLQDPFYDQRLGD